MKEDTLAAASEYASVADYGTRRWQKKEEEY